MNKEKNCSALQEMIIKSSLDGAHQPILYYVPEAIGELMPVLIALHQWSTDYRGVEPAWLEQATQRGWAYFQPNFRGPNFGPEACGSDKAQQDILDLIDWVLTNLAVDHSRIYLAGCSGGGHMAMLMAGRHPQAFTAVSEWVGISDLAIWYAEHYRDGEVRRYAKNIEACVGGPPGSSEDTDRQLKMRSPVFHLAGAKDLPIDFNAGVLDGHTGSVPIHHTIDAFNVIAQFLGQPTVTQEEIRQLWTRQRLINPQPQDEVPDPTYSNRKIFLRRFAGSSRLTIFEGGHEALAFAACEWLARYRKTVK
ncbi:MAG: prolyl oligopeptidase family serine peptidase [Phycisphaerae bacterium]